MLEMSYNTRRNTYKLFTKLRKYELRKQFFVNRVVKLWNMLPDEVVLVGSVSSFKVHLEWMGFGVTGICIIITKPTCSTKGHNLLNISKVFVVIHVYNIYVGWK